MVDGRLCKGVDISHLIWLEMMLELWKASTVTRTPGCCKSIVSSCLVNQVSQVKIDIVGGTEAGL